ncbi:hypothetical protein [Micromonospora sp. CPCC 206061]|uniref:hypothetical protein n=1 Tax=Micromonospora sp. CPCC 206061 TaxID=3122410 RepID=UPI002FF0BC6B
MAESEKSTVDRRRLLRRAGTVAAGVAGAGVAGAVAATPAQAAPGQPVLQGQNNNVGTNVPSTGIQASSPELPTLALYNPNETPVEGGTAAGPALQLVPHGDWLNDDAPAGSLAADGLGLPWVSVQYPGFTFSHAVHSTFNSNTTVPVTPTRAIDTRNTAGRARILNAAGNLDSAGRLIAGRSVNIDLSDLAFFPNAVLLNATVTGQGAAGFLTVWAYNTTRPGVSSVNYSPGQNLSNFVFSASGWDDTSVASGLSVFTSQTTHFLLDIVAFVVSDGAVNPNITSADATAGLRGAASSAAATRAQAVKKSKPSWQ